MDLVYFTPSFTRETLHQDFNSEEKINFTASKLEEEMSSPRRDPTQSRASHPQILHHQILQLKKEAKVLVISS
jgi:hypothetical protein